MKWKEFVNGNVNLFQFLKESRFLLALTSFPSFFIFENYFFLRNKRNL